MTEFHEEEEDYFCRFTFGQFVSLALLELVALFFVFYLGARYGPDLLGQNGGSKTASLTELSSEESVEFPTGAVEEEVEYTYPETLTRKKEEKPVSAEPEKKAFPPKEVQPAATAIPQQPASGKPGKFSIQVGSYSKASGAAEKINRWQGKGYDAFMSIGDVPNKGTWYRVRIGNFATRESAKKFLDKLTGREKVSAIIVRNKS